MQRPDAGDEWARIIAEGTLRRVLADRRAREEVRARGRAAARRLAERLAREPAVRRVILFGSLAGEGGLVHTGSDIDLAVEGLSREREGAIASELSDLAGMHVDLVRVEDATPEFRRRIDDEGEVLLVAG